MPSETPPKPSFDPFSDPEAVAHYAERPRRQVPGFDGLHRMTGILLAERAPDEGDVLVVGAGGGLELKALAEAYPRWRFVGVDPSAEMLKLATRTLGDLATRARLIEGTIDDAPLSAFDAATCLLTLHFLNEAERRHTLSQIRRRLKPGAPFVAAHLSFPQAAGEREQWLARYTAFAIASGVEAEHARSAKDAITARLDLFGPEQEEAMLRDAGFSKVSLFYTGFTFRGWVAYA